ncbi:RdgB/HAM1 family non-canonical purine NTP pyrophosphatase [Alicyclobacillus vulcanalis]|uniref:dITP/XTP pyrophosphatase n=1 Tax=Alicyclobacillus vulcanalis TaxID=252246 RepID=A0A1N7KRL8_9BACL|nr:RdgB/HAM1 family non-canonical purine NTP pyrophosphatase [Alicyclobacillus vulcanalis]SIS64195.1 XTP/dITP diphosphohydrolase [Alicyclobacillus vulcanalis]
MMRLVLATQNPNKVREFSELLESRVDLVALPPGLPKAPETGDTFLDNARQKAMFYAAHVGGFVVADDSGLVVPALDGEPGVFSARYAGEGADDRANNEKLIRALRAKGLRRAEARFVCALVVASERESVIEVEAWVDGHVHDEPRGENGFGYDPLFSPEGEARRFAEMSAEEKHRFSHRARAARMLLARLSSAGQATGLGWRGEPLS